MQDCHEVGFRDRPTVRNSAEPRAETCCRWTRDESILLTASNDPDATTYENPLIVLLAPS